MVTDIKDNTLEQLEAQAKDYLQLCSEVDMLIDKKEEKENDLAKVLQKHEKRIKQLEATILRLKVSK